MLDSQAFPGKYLDSNLIISWGGRCVMTIAACLMEEVGRDKEVNPVLQFMESEKGLVLNKTNWNMIVAQTGQPDSDNWRGHQVTLHVVDTEYAGKPIKGIRVMDTGPAPMPVPQAPPMAPPPPAPVPAGTGPMAGAVAAAMPPTPPTVASVQAAPMPSAPVAAPAPQSANPGIYVCLNCGRRDTTFTKQTNAGEEAIWCANDDCRGTYGGYQYRLNEADSHNPPVGGGVAAAMPVDDLPF